MNLTAQIFEHVGVLDKLMFTKHFSMMLKSGIPLAEVIATLKDQTKNSAFKKVLEGVLKDINNGQSLSKALALYPRIFNSLYLNLVGVGEKSGSLEENLHYLVTQQEKSYEFHKKVQSALLYPAIVLIATFGVGISLSLFVLPKLLDLFKSLDAELPLSTKILMFFAQLMKDYGVIITGSLFLFCFLLYFTLNTKTLKPRWHLFLLALPTFGTLLQNIELSSICRNLGTMLKSGLPLTSALEAEHQTVTNLVYKDYLAQILKSVNKGQTIEETLLSNRFNCIPHFMAKMIGVGEKSGRLEETFLYLGDFFEEEVDDVTKNLANILEPILLLVIGAVVAFVAMAIISPIYQLAGSIRGR